MILRGALIHAVRPATERKRDYIGYRQGLLRGTAVLPGRDDYSIDHIFNSVFEIWLKDRRDGYQRSTPTGQRRRAGKLRRQNPHICAFRCRQMRVAAHRSRLVPTVMRVSLSGCLPAGDLENRCPFRGPTRSPAGNRDRLHRSQDIGQRARRVTFCFDLSFIWSAIPGLSNRRWNRRHSHLSNMQPPWRQVAPS